MIYENTKREIWLRRRMEITLYTLVNDNGVEVSVMNYGATVTSVLLPVGNGNKKEYSLWF